MAAMAAEAQAAPDMPGDHRDDPEMDAAARGRASLLNIAMSFLAMAIGTVVGVPLGLAQISLLPPVRGSSWFVTQFFRNSPWLVLLFYCMLLLPFEVRIGDTIVPLPGWLKSTIGLSLPVMANVSELVRGAVRSIPLRPVGSGASRSRCRGGRRFG